MLRRASVFITVGVAALAGLTVAPASADPVVPVVSDLDTSVPGHLSGTVTSPGAPYLAVRFAPGTTAPRQLLTLSGDSTSFDLQTWGYEGERPIWIQVCANANHTACAEPVQVEQTFIALDVAPTSVDWSADLTLGKNQHPSASATDIGGGLLLARWSGTGVANPTTLGQPNQILTSIGGSGTGRYVVSRCFSYFTDACITYPALDSPTYTFKRDLQVTPTIPLTGPGSTATTIDIDTDAQGLYDVEWHLERYNQVLASPQGSAAGQTLGPDGELDTIEIPAGDLADGSYTFVTTVTVNDPEFGGFSTTREKAFRVNRLAPVIPAITINTRSKYKGLPAIYPNGATPDHSAFLRVNTTTVDTDPPLKVEIHNASGDVVRILNYGSDHATWTGSYANGDIVPSGVYTISFRDTDGLVAAKTAKVYVEQRKRVRKNWTRTVTARGSLVEQYVGRCSTLRKPAARGWAGSLGFYSNTKCAKKVWRASAVSTMHRVLVPAADRYIAFRVDVYGGAARARRSSHAGFRLFGTNQQWRGSKVLDPYLGNHFGDRRQGPDYARGLVFPDRSFYWGIATQANDKYDVKSFKISVTYEVLQ